MLLPIQNDKARAQSNDNHDQGVGDLPPAYDAISLHQPSHIHADHQGSSSSFLQAATGSYSKPFDPEEYSNFAKPKSPALEIDKSLPSPPKSPIDDTSSPTGKTSSVCPQKLQKRKNYSWLSLLPFVSSSSSKRVRQSVQSIVSDLVASSSHPTNPEHQNVHDVLSSVAERCSEHKLSLSSILQETFIADHTPMYWAVVNYRQELLVALFFHARPLSLHTILEIRRACIASSNQALFQALRVRRPPFHRTDGIQIPSLRTASDSLLLGPRPSDDIHIQQSSNGAFIVQFEISVWQKRMRAIGQVNIEFIASGRMWSVTFFSTNPPSQTSGKSKKGAGVWHVMVTLLEASPPTFFDSQLVIDVPAPLPPQPLAMPMPKLREARSTTFPTLREKWQHDRPSSYDARNACERMGRSDDFLGACENGYGHPQAQGSSSKPLPPPTHPLRGSAAPSSPKSTSVKPPSITLRLTAGDRKLGRRTGNGEPPGAVETPTTKPETWSDNGVNYTNAAVSLLGEGSGSQLLYDNSRYLLPDGTMRGRLEVRLVKSESSSKDCIIC